MGRRKSFVYTDKKHTAKGILSTILAAASISIFIIAIVISFTMKGNAGMKIGSVCLASIFTALIGFVAGIMSFWEQEKYYLFSKLGSLLNFFILIFWIGIYIVGF